MATVSVQTLLQSNLPAGPTGPVGPKCLTIISPNSTENITLFYTDTNLTIADVGAVCTGTSPNISFSINTDADRSATGTALVVNNAVTSTTTGNFPAIANTSIRANTWVWVQTNTNSGTVLSLAVAMTFVANAFN